MSEPCRRFDETALERLEAGLPLDRHFQECPECLRQRAEYERILKGLRAVGLEDEPTPGWEERVRARLASRTARPFRRRNRLAAATGVIVAAAAAYLLVVRRPVLQPPSLAVTVVAGAGQLRGASPHVGDTLELRANTGGARFAELRIYRNDNELVFRCAQGPKASTLGNACLPGPGAIVGSFLIPSIGSYLAVLCASDSALPVPSGNLDGDSARLTDSAAKIVLGPTIPVY